MPARRSKSPKSGRKSSRKSTGRKSKARRARSGGRFRGSEKHYFRIDMREIPETDLVSLKIDVTDENETTLSKAVVTDPIVAFFRNAEDEVEVKYHRSELDVVKVIGSLNAVASKVQELVGGELSSDKTILSDHPQTLQEIRLSP